MTARRCLGCHTLIPQGSRCSSCRSQQRAKYRGDWPRIARAVIADHVATHGAICPGWRRGAHAVQAADLTADHVTPGTTEGGIAVLCRRCNSSKRDGRMRGPS